MSDYKTLERTLFYSKHRGHTSTTLFGSSVDGTFTPYSDLDIIFPYTNCDSRSRCQNLRTFAEQHCHSSLDIDPRGSCSDYVLQGRVRNSTIKFQVVVSRDRDKDWREIVKSLDKSSKEVIVLLKVIASLFVNRCYDDKIPVLPGSTFYTLAVTHLYQSVWSKAGDETSKPGERLYRKLLEACEFLGEYSNCRTLFGVRSGLLSGRYMRNDATWGGVPHSSVLMWERLNGCFRAMAVLLKSQELPKELYNLSGDENLSGEVVNARWQSLMDLPLVRESELIRQESLALLKQRQEEETKKKQQEEEQRRAQARKTQFSFINFNNDSDSDRDDYSFEARDYTACDSECGYCGECSY